MPHTVERHPGGRFVPREDVHPLCNIARRSFRTNKGRVGTQSGYESFYFDPDEWIAEWYFAPNYRWATKVPAVRHIGLNLRKLGLAPPAD